MALLSLVLYQKLWPPYGDLRAVLLHPVPGQVAGVLSAGGVPQRSHNGLQ